MNNQQGFTIIGSVLVLSMVLILIASSTALYVQNYMGQSTGIEQWVEAQRLAEGCAEHALMQLRESASYTGSESILIGENSCTIRPMLMVGVTHVLQTEATVSGRPYRLEIELDDAETVNVISWRHVTTF